MSLGRDVYCPDIFWPKKRERKRLVDDDDDDEDEITCDRAEDKPGTGTVKDVPCANSLRQPWIAVEERSLKTS